MCMYGADPIEGLSPNVHYLYNNSIVIDDMKFYGIPMFMEDCMDGKLDMFINNIPDDVDILITHMPPKEYVTSPTTEKVLSIEAMQPLRNT